MMCLRLVKRFWSGDGEEFFEVGSVDTDGPSTLGRPSTKEEEPDGCTDESERDGRDKS